MFSLQTAEPRTKTSKNAQDHTQLCTSDWSTSVNLHFTINKTTNSGYN